MAGLQDNDVLELNLLKWMVPLQTVKIPYILFLIGWRTHPGGEPSPGYSMPTTKLKKKIFNLQKAGAKSGLQRKFNLVHPSPAFSYFSLRST